jgi:hypothetical protein
MCDVKHAFERVAQIDSQNLKHLGQDWNLPWLEQEAAHNEKNPGRAITKAAEYAALAYLGGAAFGGSGEAGAAADASGAAAGAAGDTATTIAEQQAMQQALAAQAPQGFANTLEAGATDTGYTPSTLWNALKNYNSGQGVLGNVANYGKAAGENAMNGGLLNQITSGGGSSQKTLQAMQGLKMIFPEQQQGRSAQAPPMQGQQGPLPSMNQRSMSHARPMSNVGPYGTSAGNSLGFTEEQKQKLRELGYDI